MSNKVKIFIAIAAVVILAALFFYFKSKPAEPAPATEASQDPQAPRPKANDNFPLDVGSVGMNVKRLQMALNRIRPQSNLLEDGTFGSLTRAALLMSVPVTLSMLPLTEDRWIKIIALGNKA